MPKEDICIHVYTALLYQRLHKTGEGVMGNNMVIDDMVEILPRILVL